MPRKLPNLKEKKSDQFSFRADLADPEVYGTIEKFIIWCKRESLDFQDAIFQSISESVDRHYYGNFQTMLQSYEPDGIKSEGQLEQIVVNELVSEYEKYKIPINTRNIIKSLRGIGMDPSKIAAARERVIEQLLMKEVEITR